ncbi:hypothetical protein, partial [Dolichospermum sp. UHCC 0259]|uniref:hypothetical protein n=1 Tax=Dolichospermum sp. UHCC 0259 TaxID=2590010 RepID=UPI00144893D9
LSHLRRSVLGTNWIKPEIYQQFAKEILKIKVTISHITSSSTSFWTIGGNSDDLTEYGTSYIDSAKLLEKGLNRQDPRIIIFLSHYRAFTDFCRCGFS